MTTDHDQTPGDDDADIEQDAGADERPDDDAIRALVTRLGRPHRSGGYVIERASLMAEGADFAAVMAWIEAHGGEAEHATRPRAPRGLHSPRQSTGGDGESLPLRFIVPADALGASTTT